MNNCPRCGKMYDGYSALSRGDNKTNICPACGTDEALINYMHDNKFFLEHSILWMKEAGLDIKKVKKRLKELK